jgi:uncharacterized protein YabE (DUF348 family)
MKAGQILSMTKFNVKEHYRKAARYLHVRKAARAARHPAVTIPLATFAVLLTLTVLALVLLGVSSPKLRAADTRIAIVTHDKEEMTVPTNAKTVGELLDRLDIKLGDGDIVEPARDAAIGTDNFRINVYRAAPVTIVDGDRKTFTFSAAVTPRSIVKQKGVEVYPEDRLEFIPTDNFLLEGSLGQRVVINRATPINVNLYGTQVKMRTHATTVGELLKERNINLGEDDSVEPARNTPIKRNMQIFLLQKGTQLATVEEEIEMPVEEVEDASLSFGASVIRQQGSPGKRLVTYRIQLENGKEVARQEIQSVIVQEAVKQIVAIGRAVQIPTDRTGLMAAAGISSSDYPYVDFIISHESSWNYLARNPSSGAYGLCQSLPASKMASAGPDWEHNPVTQLRWCHGYALGRYGSWGAAYDFWQRNHWW